ncbi:MAG: homoserine O-acetyltransferase MetX [Rhodothermales bacterium]
MAQPQTAIVPELPLERGGLLREVPVAYQAWGRLNEARDNAVVVCHALTGNTDAADWWRGLIGPGNALDTDVFFVICMSVPGSPYGTVSPLTHNPATGRPYGADFPRVTIRDAVALHRALLEKLDVRQVALAIGGSMGGMQALEWAFYGDFVRSIAPVAVGGQHSAWCIGWSEAQRQAIYADPRWQGGRYASDAPPAAGLAAARMMAMISYRSRPSFEARFGREQMPSTVNGQAAPFTIESYLRYQGQKLVERFDPLCYVRLTELMDTHDVARGRGDYADVLARIEQPALVVGIDTDVLYPIEEQEELARLLPNAELAVLASPHGHDAFLIEFDQLNRLLQTWMSTHLEAFVSSPGPALL